MKAKVLVEESPDDIESRINDMLDRGWSLEGPVQISSVKKGISEQFVATLVHPEGKENEFGPREGQRW